jgi:hypothetical protein
MYKITPAASNHRLPLTAARMPATNKAANAAYVTMLKVNFMPGRLSILRLHSSLFSLFTIRRLSLAAGMQTPHWFDMECGFAKHLPD